eukprot:m.978587 g.978587  ORF g.978587 m.978587 type:complete len:309 (-) comp23961_c0_seq1:4147-5073(-)
MSQPKRGRFSEGMRQLLVSLPCDLDVRCPRMCIETIGKPPIDSKRKLLLRVQVKGLLNFWLSPSNSPTFHFVRAEDDSVLAPCEQQHDIKSPFCPHQIKVTCHKRCAIQDLCPWERNPFDATTVGFDDKHNPVLKHRIRVELVSTDAVKLYRQHAEHIVQCSSEIGVVLSCGHELRSTCHDVLSRPQHLHCTEQVRHKCVHCKEPSLYACSELRDSTFKVVCTRRIPKQCATCRQNIQEVPCHQTVEACGMEAQTTLTCGHVRKWRCGSQKMVSETDLCQRVCRPRGDKRCKSSPWMSWISRLPRHCT